jgi:small GTP-binding protein
MNECKYKIVIIGDSGVGKSCILLRLIKNMYIEQNNSTIGAAYFVEKIIYKDKYFSLDYWDTAGQERFRSLLPIYFRSVNILMIVIDVTLNIKDQMINWFSYYQNIHFFDKSTLNKSHYVFLIFTKIDIVPNFSLTAEEKYLYENYVLPENVFFVSSKENIGIDNLKNTLYNYIYKIFLYISSTTTNINNNANNININNNDNNDNNDNKKNYDYYVNIFKKKCFYF